MRTALVMTWLLVLLASFASFATAQDDPAVVACRRCANVGSKECTKHGKDGLAREAGVRFCSEVASCKSCGGALHKDCTQCANPRAERAMQERRDLAADWLAERQKSVDDVAKGKPLMHVRTEHLDLSYGVRSLTVGRKKLDMHEGMHLYAERIESLRTRFLQLFELEDRDLPARLQVFVCADLQSKDNLAPAVTGIGTTGGVGVKLMGVDAVYCMWQDPRSVRDDDDLHRNLVHNIAHLLVANMLPSQRFGNPGNGWIDEGLAHWFEDQVVGRCANYCFEEVLMQPGQSFHGGRWRGPVRRMLDAGELVPLAALAPKNTDQLTFPEHAQAFAYADYMLTVHGGAKVRDFVRAIKQGKPMRDSMGTVFARNPLTFDEDFKTWVKDNYSPQDKR